MSSPAPADISQNSFKFDLSTFLPVGHEKALKQAIYNVAAFIFVLFVFAAFVAAYYVLEPFLRPLLWAVLFGSVLHPFKRKLAEISRKWLLDLQNSGTPLTIGTFVTPFRVINSISDRLLGFIMQYAIAFAAVIAIVFCTLVLVRWVPNFIVSGLLKIFPVILQLMTSLLEFCHGATMFVWTVVFGYIIVLTFWWTPNTKRYIVYFSPFIWTVFICHMVSIAGSLQLSILLVLAALLTMGFIAEMRGKASLEDSVEVSSGDHVPVTPIEALRSWIKGSETEELQTPVKASDTDDLLLDSGDSQNVQVEPSTPERTNLGRQRKRKRPKSDEKMSNYLLYILLWACVLSQIYLHMWLLNLLLIPSIYIAIKYAAIQFGIVNFIKTKWTSLWDDWKDTLEERKDAILPSPIRGLWKILVLGDEKVLTLLESSIDTFTSIAAILAVIVFATFATIFITAQIYGESMHLVTVTSSLINKTVHNSEIQQLIPEGLRDVQGTLETMMNDAYMYARASLKTTIRKIIVDKNADKADELEKQILDVFDRVYNLWVTRNSNVSTTDFQQMASFGSLVDGLKTLNVEQIFSFVKENIGTFLSVLDSVWIILKGNISLALSTITAVLSLLFGGGSAVINFFVNFIIFSTSLFYLLCASGEQYKPVELFNSLLPSSTSGAKFGLAVEEAINGVFAASFKMAAFYGLYTWLIHTLFDVKIVYVPSVLAAVLGAVPFIGPYWACLPAVLELWLVNGQVGKAGFILACQIIPTYFVDNAIYSEITGSGHPYITGLAIAGGLFCFGFEGALFGPMLLCVLFVAMNMYGSVIQPSNLEGLRGVNARPFSLKRTNSR